MGLAEGGMKRLTIVGYLRITHILKRRASSRGSGCDSASGFSHVVHGVGDLRCTTTNPLPDIDESRTSCVASSQ